MEFLAQYHPQIVHFPIALLMAYFLFEILTAIFKKEYLSKGAHLLLLLGVLGALAAVLTGKQAEEAFDYFNKQSSALLEEHQDWATITLWYFATVLGVRTVLVIKKVFSAKMQYLFVVLAAIGAFFVFQTGDHGGKMVYKYGIGTQYKIEQEESK